MLSARQSLSEMGGFLVQSRCAPDNYGFPTLSHTLSHEGPAMIRRWIGSMEALGSKGDEREFREEEFHFSESLQEIPGDSRKFQR